MENVELYEILGVNKNSTDAEIKKVSNYRIRHILGWFSEEMKLAKKSRVLTTIY